MKRKKVTPLGAALDTPDDELDLLALVTPEDIEDAKAAAKLLELGPAAAQGTLLDRVHQAMLLFHHNQADALKEHLQRHGRGTAFWTLADSLAKLYPSGSEEKRLLGGLLTRRT